VFREGSSHKIGKGYDRGGSKRGTYIAPREIEKKGVRNACETKTGAVKGLINARNNRGGKIFNAGGGPAEKKLNRGSRKTYWKKLPGVTETLRQRRGSEPGTSTREEGN